MYRNFALFVAVIGIVMAYGCAEFKQMQAGLDQFQMNGEVRGNVFTLKSARLELTVDNELRHAATLKEERAPGKNSFENDVLENTTQYVSHIFVDAEGSSAVKRGVIIRTRTTIGNPNQVVDPLLPHPRYELFSGTTKILGDEYNSYAAASDNLFTEQEQRTLSAGTVSGCFLVKGLERDFSVGNKSLLQILYFERIASIDGEQSCSNWQNPGSVTAEQEKYLSAFLDRSYQGIRFVKGGEATDATEKYVDQVQPKETPAEPQPAAPAQKGGDIEKRLEILKDLRDKNLITQEEYERKKAEILQEL